MAGHADDGQRMKLAGMWSCGRMMKLPSNSAWL